MALIQCTECGNNVSTLAISCPNCGAPVNISISKEEASSPPEPDSDPTPAKRRWLAALIIFAVLLNQLVPALALMVGVSLAAVVTLYLYYAPLRNHLGGFLRISAERAIHRSLKLATFGAVAMLLIFLSATQYYTRFKEGKIAEQLADADAARERAIEAANAQVMDLVGTAKSALASNNIGKAQQALVKITTINMARNRGAAEQLSKIIKDASDGLHTLGLLDRLSDAEFEALKNDGVVPKALLTGYAVLDGQILSDAKSQLATAERIRAENREAETKQAEADQMAALAKQQEAQRAAIVLAEQKKAAAAAADKPSDYETWAMAKQYVTDNLKAPSTASFGGWFDQIPSENVSALGDNVFVVRIWVDAQNSFGAMLRSHYVVTLHYNGNGKWQVQSFNSED